jgi:hypothetical protein
MSLFIDNNDEIELIVKYVYDKNGEVCVLSDENVKHMDDGNSSPIELGEEMPFNIIRVDSSEVDKSDIKKAFVNIRKPSFSDISTLTSALSSGAEGGITPSQLINYNKIRLITLFKNGKAQDEDGEYHDITVDNLAKLSPALGIGLALKISDFL